LRRIRGKLRDIIREVSKSHSIMRKASKLKTKNSMLKTQNLIKGPVKFKSLGQLAKALTKFLSTPISLM
jgi:hypothetical protein